MKTLTYLPILLTLTAPVLAQQLTLFEAVDSGPEPTRPNQPELISMPGSASPAFTLRSSSRFGDEYRSVLVARDGKSVEVVWKAGERAEVPGYFGYSVLSVDSSGLSLQLPAGERCVTATASGVECSASGASVLSMVTLSPLQTNGTQPAVTNRNANTETRDFAGQNVVVGPEGPQFVVNPFTGMAEEAEQVSEAEMSARVERARLRAERLSQFEPTRIPDEDVPAGMRVVRTPFGDRLVPERQ